MMGNNPKNMKKYICLLAAAALFSACEQKTETVTPAAPAAADHNTTIVNPPANKSETKTTIVNPTPAESKTETNTTINTAPASTPNP